MCESSGVPGRATVQCSFSNDLESLTCSFDGGESEECELPLVFDIDRFSVGVHTVVLMATDEFGQTFQTSIGFIIGAPCKQTIVIFYSLSVLHHLSFLLVLIYIFSCQHHHQVCEYQLSSDMLSHTW